MRIIGHQKQRGFLRDSFRNLRLAHAYLFFGPEQVGKRTLALEFAKMINCQEELFEKKPCNLCPACQMIGRLAHPDFIFVGLAEEKAEIEVGQIRDLIGRLSLKPFLANYKVGLINDAHLMNVEAQNCLLKTLEEPMGDTVLILVSSHREGLLPTVLSRVQEVFFSPVPNGEIKEFLVGERLNKEETDKVLHFSLGKPGKAIELLQEPARLAKEKKAEKNLADVLNSDLAGRFKKAEALAKNYSPEVLEIWLRSLRGVLLEKVGNGESAAMIEKNIQSLERATFLINNSAANKRLVLENLMINLGSGK